MTADPAWVGLTPKFVESAIRVGAMPADLFAAKYSEISRTDRARRLSMLRLRFYTDKEAFCRYLWPDRFSLPFNELHRDLFGLTAPRWKHRLKSVNDAVAAPRGYAKSTIVSFAEIVHDIVYDSEAYIILLSATQRLSFSLSKDLRAQFRTKDASSKLLELYGPFETSGPTAEWEVSVAGRPSVGLLARSFGTEVRGAKHPMRGIRPTKVVIDDGEKKDRVRNPEQRALLWEALTKDVLKLEDRRLGCHYKIVGTVLHPASMLATLLGDAGWRTRKYKAVLAWPDREDLWAKCKGIWTDLTLGQHRRALALKFWERNKAEMSRGAILLDDAAKDLFELHEILWRDGLASFLSEMQNDPVDPTSRIFWSEKFKRFRLVNGEVHVLNHNGGVERRVLVSEMRLHMHWDPTVGTPGGDFASIAVVGRDRYGYSYVLDVWLSKARPSVQLSAAWELSERWGCVNATVESNGFQTLVAEPWERQRNARRENGRWWRMALDPVNTGENKELRIASLEPDVTNGWLLFSDSLPSEGLEQFDHFPTGDHDDFPDSIHAAWANLGGRPVKMVGSKEAA